MTPFRSLWEERRTRIRSETFEKCKCLSEFKEGENFNHRNTWSISRIALKRHFVQNLNLTQKSGKKGFYAKVSKHEEDTAAMNDFWNWWQHLPEKINPVILNLGGFKLQYYGLMYIVAFAIVVCFVLFRIKRENGFEITASQIMDLSMMMLFGLIVGGRLGYVLFYNLPYYFKHPLEIFLPFEFSGGIRFVGISGMSFHGGLLGVIISAVLYIRKAGLNFWETADLFVPAIPLGYTFGRLGNFINGELYGRMTSLPVGMYFPLAPGPELRHPSQLYEAFFEGIFLFAVLWHLRKRKTPPGAMLGFYLIGYGVVRFFIEYCRQPDEHLGFILWSFSMGQVLCGIMIIVGVFLYLYLYHIEKQRIALS